MRTSATKASRLVGFALAAALMTAGACHSSTEPEHEETPHAVRLSFNGGAQVVTIVEGQVNASVNLPTATSATVTAQWLDDNMTVMTEITGDEYELRITGRTFTRTGPFAGTISGLTSGSNTITVQLFHLGEAHTDFQTTLNIVVL